jgi:hypothetical protein
MIRGIHASVFVPEDFFEGKSFVCDDLGIAIRREYKAGAAKRDSHGSPSWAEFLGMNGGPGVVVAARGVFGDVPLGNPTLILDSTSPAEDASDLVARGYEQVGETIHDRWWHDIAIVRGPDGITLVLVSNTGDRTEVPGETTGERHEQHAR